MNTQQVNNMTRYNKYNIKGSDSFDINDYPKVQAELEDLIKATEELPAKDREQIILSYVKDHSVKKEWKDSNPELTSLLTGDQLSTSHLKSLYSSCQQNKLFLNEMENYIRKSLTEKVTE